MNGLTALIFILEWALAAKFSHFEIPFLKTIRLELSREMRKMLPNSECLSRTKYLHIRYHITEFHNLKMYLEIVVEMSLTSRKGKRV